MQRATITILLILFASVMMSMSGNRIMHLDTSNGMISNNVSMLWLYLDCHRRWCKPL